MSHCLEGKTLTGVKIADDGKAILFQTTEGDVVAKADGDCCSDTWIENVELPALGFPAVVQEVQDLDLPERDEQVDYYGEVIAFYGCKVSTDKGDLVIDYRNESNGYYGGNLSWPDDYFYGGVFDQNVSTEKWVEVGD